MSNIKKTAGNTLFTAVNIGSLNQISEHILIHPVSGQEIKGKVFLKNLTGATGTEISYNTLPPKTELNYFHSHIKNEETILIIKGSGVYQVDDECFEISEGSVIRIAPSGKRGMTNTSDEPMIYIIIQSKAGSLEEYSSEDGSRTEWNPKWNK